MLESQAMEGFSGHTCLRFDRCRALRCVVRCPWVVLAAKFADCQKPRRPGQRHDRNVPYGEPDRPKTSYGDTSYAVNGSIGRYSALSVAKERDIGLGLRL